MKVAVAKTTTKIVKSWREKGMKSSRTREIKTRACTYKHDYLTSAIRKSKEKTKLSFENDKIMPTSHHHFA